MEHVSSILQDIRQTLEDARDSEISMASEILSQYVQDHRDKDAYREIDRTVSRLATAWDRMITRLEKWETDARKIEHSVENFYGD